MKATERYLGIILEHTQITAVEIAHSPKGHTLTAAGSFVSSMLFDNQDVFSQSGATQRERKFAQELSSFLKSIGSAAAMMSFGLNTRMVMLDSVPMDATLSQSEIDQHVRWELAHYMANAMPQSYSISALPLESDGSVTTTAIIAVRKTFVNFLSHVCTLIGGNLNIVDVDHFTAENALLYNYPDISAKNIILAGVDEESMDASVMRNGAATRIITFSRNDDGGIASLASLAKEVNPDTLYMHGRLVTPELVEQIKSTISTPVETVDPFVKVNLPKTIKNYEDVFQHRHEFAAAVGLALRME
jgi:Tfp pilus assembly PilM family ATPase